MDANRATRLETEVASLDLLPRYSPWPARILGAEPWAPRVKTRAEVLREFDKEKWGTLRARLAAAPSATVDDVEAWDVDMSAPTLVTLEDGAWRLVPRAEARRHYIDLVAATLSPLIARTKASAIVELGCGFGATVLRIAARPQFRGLPFLAADLSAGGQEVARRLVATAGLEVSVGGCDLEASVVTDLAVPPNALVYTSFAAHYLPTGTQGFVAALAALRPAAVVHFEPIYEHADPTTTLGLMRRRYIELNGYTRDLSAQLHAPPARILEERKAVFGENPLLPASVITWSPA